MRDRRWTIAWTALALCAPARAAGAEPPVRIRVDPARDLAVTGAAIAVAASFQFVLDKRLVPTECRWCNPPGFDASARDALLWNDPRAANTISNVSAYAGAPAVAFGMNHLAAAADGRGGEAWENDLVIAEAGATAVALSEMLKPAFGRARPAVHYGDARAPAFGTYDRNTSFYSGHTSFAFSVVVASGTLASRRRYSLAPMVWAGGLAVAALTGYTRMAADAHYLSDVVAAAAIGSGVGLSASWLLHPALAADGVAWLPVLAPTPGGAVAGIAGLF